MIPRLLGTLSPCLLVSEVYGFSRIEIMGAKGAMLMRASPCTIGIGSNSLLFIAIVERVYSKTTGIS
jgi:hypothetical protein